MNPFDFVEAAGKTKRDIIAEDPDVERDYNPYLVNRAFSMHVDSIMLANEMNSCSHLPKRLQFEFFRTTLPAVNRRGRWPKPLVDDDSVGALAMRYGISKKKARESISVLSEEDLKTIMRDSQDGKQ